jgi:hypothetical protein
MCYMCYSKPKTFKTNQHRIQPNAVVHPALIAAVQNMKKISTWTLVENMILPWFISKPSAAYTINLSESLIEKENIVDTLFETLFHTKMT